MLLFFLLCCASVERDNPDIDFEVERPKLPERLAIRSVRVCAVLADDSPSFPERIVFLYRASSSGVEAQAELFGDDATKLRCGEVRLHLPEGSDGTPVTMDRMPSGGEAVAQVRAYRDVPGWSPTDSYAVARMDDRGDYVFLVNMASPAANDPSTIFLP